MSSCNNSYLISHLIKNSGLLEGHWEMILTTNDYQPSCTKMVTNEMISPNCIIGRSQFAVSFDADNICINLAQDKVTFPSIAHRVSDIAYAILMTPIGMAAAIYGTDLLFNLIRANPEGNDLIIHAGTDRAIFGL